MFKWLFSRRFIFRNYFLEENINSLNFLINNNSFKGVYLIGMPFLFQEVIFNVAVVIQNKKILGIVPKQMIPNYKEFSEKDGSNQGNI